MSGQRHQTPGHSALAFRTDLRTRTSQLPRRPWLAAYAAQLAVGAYGGALALTMGFLQLPTKLSQRLPFGSSVFGAAALTALVGLPATVVMVMAWWGHRWVLHAAVLDGVLVIGWILVEVAFLRELSFLQPFYVGVGAGLVVWGCPAIPDLLHEARSLLHRGGSLPALTRGQTGPVRSAATDRTRDRDTIHNLDENEQRAFWVRSAQNMWAGREKERQCRLQAPHPEHNYRYDSTPDHLMYWCRGRDSTPARLA